MIAQLCNSHGFFHGWTQTKYHHEIFRAITTQIEQHYTGNCSIVDDTWLSRIATEEKFVEMYPNVMRENIEHIFFISLVDEPSVNLGLYQEIIQQLTTAKHKHQIITKSKFSFWGYFCQCEFWSDYHKLDLPWTGNKLFLSYNRKPATHRKKLVNQFKADALIDSGIITLGNYDASKCITIGPNYGIPNSDIDGDVGVPNDVASLGSHSVWQETFVNVVTETVTHGKFLSEKIWKPIIGKRPFMLVGPPRSFDQLHDWGFKTFNDFWNEEYNDFEEDEQIEDICALLRILDGMSIVQLKNLYAEMQPILDYNHKHFFTTFVKDNRKLIDTLVRDEM